MNAVVWMVVLVVYVIELSQTASVISRFFRCTSDSCPPGFKCVSTCVDLPCNKENKTVCEPVREECTGGRVWKVCGSPCTLTCHTPKDMGCIALCRRGCECPRTAPIWNNGSCIKKEDCDQEVGSKISEKFPLDLTASKPSEGQISKKSTDASLPESTSSTVTPVSEVTGVHVDGGHLLGLPEDGQDFSRFR
ncbi:uncharacterized protein LOC106181663 [Lingula anatina]|uniref:Uncharacterized protein LOC106181663 n=1 Tax=Lingula anatina TaxID=7574 RepID=A0A1S3KGH8_LINAN|nr:uncharacterized protein LOC106181663 [Lingula anatina]|eukprot:XP_013421564.1 uncharacterized protein LOC106181663 [Lingula anatina]